MAVLRVINLAVRFVLELAALAAFAYWAAHADAAPSVRIAWGISAPILVAVFWGHFVSPKARFSSGRFGQVGLGLVVFLAAAVALFLRDQSRLAVAFACVAIVSSALLYASPQ